MPRSFDKIRSEKVLADIWRTIVKIRTLLKRFFEITGYTVVRKTATIPSGIPGTYYDQDGLRTIHNHEFMLDPSFQEAYKRGIQAQGSMKRPGEPEYHWHWRVHIGLWAAFSASKFDGDFVECGVNKGFLSSCIMTYLKWDSLGRTFYLVDTFRGLDERFISDAERKAGVLDRNIRWLECGFYVSGVESVKSNFSEWKNVKIIEGSIPEILKECKSEKVVFLHLDLNCSAPEVAALDYFWDRLVPGAFILMDDYAYYGYRNQKLGMDAFVNKKGLKIASLPTGQGLLIKPPL